MQSSLLKKWRQEERIELPPFETASASGCSPSRIFERNRQPSGETLVRHALFPRESLIQVVDQTQPGRISLKPRVAGIDHAARRSLKRTGRNRPAHRLEEIGDERLVDLGGDGRLSADEVGNTTDRRP